MIASLIVTLSSTARVSPIASHVSPRTVAFIARHTNNVLRRKCLPTYTTHASRAKWLERHGYAHRRPRGDCRPAHHNLWICLHGHEGSWYDRDSGHNSHYGGLQMSHNWLGILPGYAYNYTPLQQMAYAERGYRESGYSSDWLWGQWGQTLPYCTRYF